MEANKMEKKSVRITKKAVLYLFVLILLVCFVFPFFWMLRTSLMEINQIFQLPPVFIPDPLYWQNYPGAFNTFPLLQFIGNSFIISILSVVGSVFTSSLCAFGFSRIQWKLRNPIFTVVLCSMMLPYAVTIIPTYLGWNAVGGVDTYLPLILPYWCGGGAMYIFLLRQFFLSIPKELDESAIVDGAGYFKSFFLVVLPQLKAITGTAILLNALYIWNDTFDQMVFLSGAAAKTLPVEIYALTTAMTAQWNLVFAAVIISLVPMLILYLLTQKKMMTSLAGGIKG